MFRLVRESARDVTLCTVDSSATSAKIGRDPKTCKVQLGTKAIAVSREHAELQWSSNGVTIVDTSSFGTLVDGVKILKSSKLLKGGERLKIGQEEFILERIEEAKRVPPPSVNKPVAKNSITSFFTKKNDMLREKSQPADVSIRKIFATETPSESQETQKVTAQSQPKKKPIRGARRVNPLFDFDEDDESVLDNAVRRVLAPETPSDSVPSQRAAAASEKETVLIVAPSPSPPARPPISTQVPTVEKKKKVSIFAKPSQRPRTQIQKPAAIDDDDDLMMLDTSVSPSNGAANSLMDDGFARPSLPRTRSRTTPVPPMEATSSRAGAANKRDSKSKNSSDDMMEMNASSIPTQVIPSGRKPVASRVKAARDLVSEPPKKKPKSIFEDHFKKQKKMSIKPREPSLLDEDDNGVLNIRYEYVPPKPVIGERAYSSIENLRIMEQMGRDAKARMEKRHGLDKLDEIESQYPSVEELTSILCSSHTEEKKDEEEKEKEKEGKEVERVGDETLDDEIKSQLVTFCDNLMVSQPDESMASVNHSQGRGFKKFKKARQGRFATQSAVFSGIIGGSDLVDFRQIQL